MKNIIILVMLNIIIIVPNYYYNFVTFDIRLLIFICTCRADKIANAKENGVKEMIKVLGTFSVNAVKHI